MNAHDLDKAVIGLPHIEGLLFTLASAQAAAGIGLWPRPAPTPEASAAYANALSAYQAGFKEARALLQEVTQSIQGTFAGSEPDQIT